MNLVHLCNKYHKTETRLKKYTYFQQLIFLPFHTDGEVQNTVCESAPAGGHTGRARRGLPSLWSTLRCGLQL